MRCRKQIDTYEQVDSNVMKEAERRFTELLPLFEKEENDGVQSMIIQTWNTAVQIYQEADVKTPFYILFQMKSMGERFQAMMYEFAIVKVKGRTHETDVIKDSLVWYCDKKKGIFSLEKHLCDLRKRTEIFPCVASSGSV